jgi:alpha-glucosidase
MRTLTRFGGENAPRGLAKLLLAVLVALKGTLLLYQGEELGLPEAALQRDQIKDPIGDLYYPLYRGRDGCRTPMPWNNSAPQLGFTTGTPWLPLAPEHRELAVSLQESDPQSTLLYARRLLELRRQREVLRQGDIEFIDASLPVLAFLRRDNNAGVFCVFNMSSGEASFQSRLLSNAAPLSVCTGGSRIEANVLSLRPYGVFLASL